MGRIISSDFARRQKHRLKIDHPRLPHHFSRTPQQPLTRSIHRSNGSIHCFRLWVRRHCAQAVLYSVRQKIYNFLLTKNYLPIIQNCIFNLKSIPSMSTFRLVWLSATLQCRPLLTTTASPTLASILRKHRQRHRRTQLSISTPTATDFGIIGIPTATTRAKKTNSSN